MKGAFHGALVYYYYYYLKDDDFSAILKPIVELEDYDHVISSEPQLQSSGHALSDDANVDQISKRGRSSQGVLRIDFVKEEFKRLKQLKHEAMKAKEAANQKFVDAEKGRLIDHDGNKKAEEEEKAKRTLILY